MNDASATPLEDALARLQAGDAPAARQRLEALIREGSQDPSAFTLLAVTCRALGDAPGQEAALDQALARDPQHLNAAIMKADLLQGRGDLPAAAPFYGLVIGIIERNPTPTPDLQRLLAHARQGQARATTALTDHLLSQLTRQGYDPATAPPRFNQAVDLLLGRRQIYHQKPRAFYFPELPQVQFYDSRVFSWAADIEDATPDIEAELVQMLQRQPDVFQPYLRADGRLAGTDPQKIRDNLGWRAYYLMQDGQTLIENAVHFPRTLAALRSAPLTQITGRAPSVLFSMLQPGAHIKPHTGFLNTRLICHLPLLVPPNCALRVGNEVRAWEKGRLMIFDDSIEHEAWNRSDQTRIVMIFDIWRPELSDEERQRVSQLLQAVDSFGGVRQRWSD